MNKTTISGIVQPLLDQHLLVEGDRLYTAEGSGKPAKPLWFSPNARPICSVLLMPGVIRTCLVTLDGRIQAEQTQPWTPSGNSRDSVLNMIMTTIGQTLKKAHRTPLGIGIAVGGMVDTDLGRIIKVNLAPILDGLMLGDALTRRFDLPVLIDHHPRALLVGDRWFGHGRGVRTFAVVYTGEVLGAAFYLNGQLHRGLGGAGGELGHTFVQVDGELCRCGQRGCWDTIATLSWLRREARKASLPNADIIDSQKLAEQASAGSTGAAELLDRYARNLAIGIANLQQMLASNLYVLHGDVALGGQMMIDAITGHVRRFVPGRPGSEVSIVVNEARDRAAMLGAAGLILSDLLQFPV
ncbi:MAG TPA: ROK family protein [Acidisoma sp.]|uniref:ROK family protein n=1 Tax=Acidisoma sp. TaxID=1872115 RepID=UPI002BF457F2|nr:ROK family protein [Acidisoma sp.]HTH99883.1 ROK family protein [Acidisoma sp.]